MIKLYKNKNWLRHKYWDEGYSINAIAKLCNTGSTTIWKRLRKFNIKTRARSEAEKLYSSKNPDATKGKNNNRWKGGRKKDSGGYMLIHQPAHPYADSKGYVYEHRLIAEKVLGRYLKINEIVHHVNKINDDNKNCNLLICTNGYHSWLHHKMRRKQ